MKSPNLSQNKSKSRKGQQYDLKRSNAIRHFAQNYHKPIHIKTVRRWLDKGFLIYQNGIIHYKNPATDPTYQDILKELESKLIALFDTPLFEEYLKKKITEVVKKEFWHKLVWFLKKFFI